MESVYQNWTRYYITSGGRIWGMSDQEKLDGEAQARRELLGNDFATAEEAAFAKAQIEARARTNKYAQKILRFDEYGNPIVEMRFYFPNDNREPLINDLRILVGDRMLGGAAC